MWLHLGSHVGLQKVFSNSHESLMEQVAQGLESWTIGFISRDLVDEQQERDPTAKLMSSWHEDDPLPFLCNTRQESILTYSENNGNDVDFFLYARSGATGAQRCVGRPPSRGFYHSVNPPGVLISKVSHNLWLTAMIPGIITADLLANGKSNASSWW